MKNFSNTPMHSIYLHLKSMLQSIDSKQFVEFEVLNPDKCTSVYAGTSVIIDGHPYMYHGYKTWIDLAQSLHCRMLTPRIFSKHTVVISFEKLNEDLSFHSEASQEEKYGKDSIFSHIYKNEESSFAIPFSNALLNVKFNNRKHILNLGINNGDEFELIKEISDKFEELKLIGIDYCESAIEIAKAKFKDDSNVELFTHDIKELEALKLNKFDLIISIGTLQSSNLSFNATLMDIVQNYLKKDGAIILGFPNCRWIDGEMIYGARVKNYNYSEMSLVYKDVMFCKKYLQQKKFRVTITGKDYIFVTATSIRKED